MTHPMTQLLVGLHWITTWLLIHHLALWFGRRDQKLNLWVAAWCAVAAAHQGARTLHYGTVDPDTAVLAVRIGAAAVAASGIVGIGAVRALVGKPRWTRVDFGLGAVSVLLFVLVLSTPLFFSQVQGLRVDPVGRELLWVAQSPAGLIWVPWGLACLGRVLLLLRRATHLPQVERGMIAAALVVYVAGGLVDSLVGLGLESILMFEFSFAAIAVGFDVLTVRRFNGLQQGLEDRVAERTVELRQTVGLLGEALTAAQEANEARAQFLANVSHEVRTPLNGLLGMTQLLGRTQLQPLQREMVQTAQSSAESVLDIVNDVLDLSKVEAGGITLVEGEVDLARSVEEATAVFAAEAQRRGLEIACLLPRDVRYRHRGDAQRFGQIVRNLLGNALKFTQAGQIRVELLVTADEDGRDLIEVQVADTGVGIPEADRARIFEAFEQAEGHPDRALPGTGLGLAIGQRLAGLMGGEIRVDSTVGVGSTFTLSFHAPRLRERAAARTALRGLRGLLVAEGGLTREAVARQLTGFGVELRVLSPEQAAAHALDDDDLELVVTVLPSQARIEDWLASGIHRRIEAQGIPQTLLLPATLGANARDWNIGPRTASFLYPALRTNLAEAIRAIAWGGLAEDSVGSTPDLAYAGASGLRVLIVEDNLVNQRVAEAMLAEIGLTGVSISGGEEAVRRAISEPWVAVLMDCQMPVMDGYTATRLIRERETGGRVPILAMTAHAMPAQRQRCLDAGMDGFLTKPVQLEQLEEALMPWLLGDRPAVAAASTDEYDASMDLDRARLVLDLVARRGLEPEAALLEPFVAGRSALRRALQGRNDRELREAAHTLAGAAANLGAAHVQEGCRQVGRSVKAGDRWATASAVDELEAAMDHAVRTLRRLLAERAQNPG